MKLCVKAMFAVLRLIHVYLAAESEAKAVSKEPLVVDEHKFIMTVFIREAPKPARLYIIRKVLIRATQKCVFIEFQPLCLKL